MDRRLLNGLTPAAFLKRHWQKKPLLVRGAFPDFRDPLTADELGGLALEKGVESRLVFEKGGKSPWELRRGPFKDSVLRKLPSSHWTLLVQEVDRYIPEAAAIVDRFNFIPGWRCDDLMVSFAPEHGSVGPHVDSYDVFLIQGQGRRRWQIAQKFDERLKKNVDLKILAHFRPESEWILEPGDMLYLPPGVAHFGVALEPCMTYSVGFRAPTHAALINGFLDLPDGAVPQLVTDTLYTDRDRSPTDDAGSLAIADIKRLQALVSAPLKDPDVVARWFLAFTTRPPARDLPAPVPRLAYHMSRAGQLYLYVDGIEHALDAALRPLVAYVTGRRLVDEATLVRLTPPGKAAKAAKDLLGLLRRQGALRFLS